MQNAEVHPTLPEPGLPTYTAGRQARKLPEGEEVEGYVVARPECTLAYLFFHMSGINKGFRRGSQFHPLAADIPMENKLRRGNDTLLRSRCNSGLATMLDEKRIRSAVGERPFRWYAKIGSTNAEALDWLREGAPAGALVLADEQLQGRGRHGRDWHTPAGAAWPSRSFCGPQSKNCRK